MKKKMLLQIYEGAGDPNAARGATRENVSAPNQEEIIRYPTR